MIIDALTPHHYDLTTPDGKLTEYTRHSKKEASGRVRIEAISPLFMGFQLDRHLLFFNIKSTLAQLGLHAKTLHFFLDMKRGIAEVEVRLYAFGPLAETMLELLSVGSYIGKLFAADDRRKVRDPDYLMRMFGRSDRKGRPLLSLGGLEGSKDLVLEKQEGRTVAFLFLKPGTVVYDPAVYGFLPTLAEALKHNMGYTRQLLHLHHRYEKEAARLVHPGEILLVKTAPLHIRTVHARVVEELLPAGIHHTSASVLQPDTYASGDIYEFFGNSKHILDDVPLEFYTLEPHREHVFFSDRDQLQSALEDPKCLFDAFATAPGPIHQLAATFVVKGTQLKTLRESDWVVTTPAKHDFPGLSHPTRQAMAVEKYIEHQPAYPFLKAIEEGWITSQGILLSRYFPTPLLKSLLLNDQVTLSLKRLYFEFPSLSHDNFFSQEDRALLVDLAKFGIPVFWVDRSSNQILQYVFKPERDGGMFVPLSLVEKFRKATVFGVYGSNLLGNFEEELLALFQGLLTLQKECNHPLLDPATPLALVTGGGPGAMEIGNRVAKQVGILSCANILDFRQKDNAVVNEQRQNPHIEAKMTYRLDRLVERQAEFYLDISIILPGGMGTDFEFSLEESRRKTGAWPPNPVLLMAPADYWRKKITSRFQLNRETGTIQGSEWVSNCFYAIETAAEGLWVLQKFFEGKLLIGKKGPIYDEGFAVVKELMNSEINAS